MSGILLSPPRCRTTTRWGLHCFLDQILRGGIQYSKKEITSEHRRPDLNGGQV